MFKYLITTAMLMVFGATSYMSVSGLVAVFSSSMTLIVILGVGMELGKILVVVYLHRNWGSLPGLFKVLYIGVAGVLLMITTCEVLGYLSLNHTVAVSGSERLIAADKSLRVEADLLRDQVRVIDETISHLPEAFVSRRIAERKAAGYEVKQQRLLEIVRERAALAERLNNETGAAGPVFAVADLLGISGQKVALFFIFVLVGVLEPLSVGLAVAVSASWESVKDEPEVSPEVDIEPKPEPEPIAAEEKPVKKGSVNYQKLMELVDEHRFTVPEIMSITGKAQAKTVIGWLDGTGKIPDKAMRAIAKYIKEKPKLRAVG